MLTEQEICYRKQITRVGIAMLIFFGCSRVFQYVLLLIDYLTSDMRMIPRIVLLMLMEAVLYSAMFLIPALVLKKLLKDQPHHPVCFSFQIPRTFPAYLFATLGISFAAGELNARIVSLFDVFSTAGGAQTTAVPIQNFEIILMVITSAVVPAFVEEFFFRGVVLGAMRPFGRTAAIVVSAFCFGLMHGNISQLLYTFVAGLVLGFVYWKLQSLWACVIIHFCNNLFSIAQSVFADRLESYTAVATIYTLKLCFVLFAIVSIVYLILRCKDQKQQLFEDGCFERDVLPDAEWAQMEIPRARRLQLFLAPTMVIFVVLSVLEIFGLLL